MKENNELLIELLTKMRIETVFNKKDKIVSMKLSDLQMLCIKLLKLESKVNVE